MKKFKCLIAGHDLQHVRTDSEKNVYDNDIQYCVLHKCCRCGERIAQYFSLEVHAQEHCLSIEESIKQRRKVMKYRSFPRWGKEPYLAESKI